MTMTLLGTRLSRTCEAALDYSNGCSRVAVFAHGTPALGRHGKAVKSKHPGFAPQANPSRPKGVSEPWFEPKNQGFDYQKNRWRPARTRSRAQSRSWLAYLPFGLSLLPIAIPQPGCEVLPAPLNGCT